VRKRPLPEARKSVAFNRKLKPRLREYEGADDKDYADA
jgi:hypothetical protein